MGAEIILGGKPLERRGFFYPPTILAGVKPGMKAYHEELFGPVGVLVLGVETVRADTGRCPSELLRTPSGCISKLPDCGRVLEVARGKAGGERSQRGRPSGVQRHPGSRCIELLLLE